MVNRYVTYNFAKAMLADPRCFAREWNGPSKAQWWLSGTGIEQREGRI